MKEKTISAEILKEKGYTEYQEKNAEFGDRFFQKRFDDNKGKKYFINCKYYFFTQNSEQLRFWEFSMQINTPKGSVEITTVQWFNEDGIHSQNKIEDVEEYFERMWLANESPYYEEFDRIFEKK